MKILICLVTPLLISALYTGANADKTEKKFSSINAEKIYYKAQLRLNMDLLNYRYDTYFNKRTYP